MLLLYIFFFRQLKREYPSAVVLSTDDYFIENGVYMFEPDLLEDAHKWNQKRARKAMKNGKSPVIIDNTNIHAWEMKPFFFRHVKIDMKLYSKNQIHPGSSMFEN
ncbi:NEDD4 binding protein 2-like 1 [Columba livia]|uniref:NEDD4 binding protein 2-like 1 n=1 Tax=Columba livia TaxID=8932 RepID=A0A2I0MCT0_COLLI|nr:NEDD4 binding protein 2-like 1 [Columba livia]